MYKMSFAVLLFETKQRPIFILKGELIIMLVGLGMGDERRQECQGYWFQGFL